MHAPKHQNRLYVPCNVICVCTRTCGKYMHDSIGYTSGAISLFSRNQVKNTTLLLTACHFRLFVPKEYILIPSGFLYTNRSKIVPPEAKIHTHREVEISNLLLMTSWNENVFCMWIVDVSLMFARTSCWTNTRIAGDMRFNISCLWFIYFSRPTCTWNSVEVFYCVFTRVQPPCSPKPTRMVIDTLRPEQWWLTLCRHFQWIFLK